MIEFLILAATFGLGLGLGYEAAVHHYRERRRLLEREVKRLETTFGHLQTQLNADPARAGIDHGKRYILNEFERFLNTLREQLP